MKFTKESIPLIIAAVLIFVIGGALGGMFVKIQYLEGKVSGVNTAAVPVAPTQPQQPQAPTKVDVKITADDPVLGDPKAKLTVVNFSDFQCPYCVTFFTNTESKLIKEYVDTGKIKYVFKQYPLPFHNDARSSANASLCAKEQNKFWEYHDKLFESSAIDSTTGLSTANLKKYATELGLDMTKFNSCLEANKYNSQIDADMAEGNRVGFSGTPSFAVGSTPIVGAQPYEQFKAAIEAQLAGAK